MYGFNIEELEQKINSKIQSMVIRERIVTRTDTNMDRRNIAYGKVKVLEEAMEKISAIISEYK